MILSEGTVVVVSTGQIGTVVVLTKTSLWAYLANGDIWIGSVGQAYQPQSQEEIDAAPRDVPRMK